MSVTSSNIKPFLKWAGGKSQLLLEIEKFYPFNNKSITKYAEPFLGGGAVLFDILGKFDLEEIYIGDINENLVNTYRAVQKEIDELIDLLSTYQTEYISLEYEARKDYYLSKRYLFNDIALGKSRKDDLEKAALMIFLNKTCFNGLYRVNKQGGYNVPMGKYKNPTICDSENLQMISQKFRHVKIVGGAYTESANFIDNSTFVYFDPPYRPLNRTANFTAYTEYVFNDNAQRELARFVKTMSNRGAKVLVSNSDPKNVDEDDDFFENVYDGLEIKRVMASRMINSKASGRGKISELLIHN